eukprot:Gb_39669 [translate_table: standard]
MSESDISQKSALRKRTRDKDENEYKNGVVADAYDNIAAGGLPCDIGGCEYRSSGGDYNISAEFNFFLDTAEELAMNHFHCVDGDLMALYANSHDNLGYSEVNEEFYHRSLWEDDIWHLKDVNEIPLQETKLVNMDEFKDCMEKKNDAFKCNIEKHAKGKSMKAPAHESGWKNVFKMQPGFMSTILVQFSLFNSHHAYPFNASAEPGYVYHCHDHEDNEMMRPFKIVY